MSKARELGRLIQAGARLAGADHASVAFGAGAGLIMLLFSFCLVPLFAGLAFFGTATRAAVGAPVRPVGTTVLAGLAMFVVLASPVSAFVLASLIAPPEVFGEAGFVIALWILLAWFGMISAPFSTTGPQLVRRGLGLSDALGRSLSAAAQEGPASLLLRGLTIAVPIALVLTLVVRFEYGWVPSLVLGPLVTAFAIGFTSACAIEDDTRLATTREPVGRTWLWLPPALGFGFLLVALGAAVLTPAPAWMFAPVPEPAWECAPSLDASGPHGLSITPSGDHRRFEVRTADGGGAGSIASGTRMVGVEVCSTVDRHWLRFHGYEHDRYALVDERGVRLDDGFSERLGSRTGWLIALLAGLGLLALFALSLRMGEVLAQLGVLSRAGEDLRSLSGKLRVTEGARFTRDGSAGWTRGEVRFVADDAAHVFVLPRRVGLLSSIPAPAIELLPDGTPLSLISAESLASLGPRTGASAWPASAMLLLGEAEGARAVLAATVARRVAPWVALSTVAFVVAALALFFQL